MAPLSTVETDDFVNVWMNAPADPSGAQKQSKDRFHSHWLDNSSAKISVPPVVGANVLRQLYPNHSLVLTQGYGFNILNFPSASVKPLDKNLTVSNLLYYPLARSLQSVPGVLVDQIQYGSFEVTWKQYEYIVYILQYPMGFGFSNQYFVLHEGGILALAANRYFIIWTGPEEVSRLFLLACGAWTDSLHDEIWVFNQGFWQKDHGLWAEVQKADWKDVILKDKFKKALQKDVSGFFGSEAIYKELAIPWKRGLIMYGPPGNGKTISLKAIMKTCGEKGYPPLYIKSLQSYKGEEGALADIFDKARQLAPCVIIFEDIDSLINDRNRSFFLNQMDGIEGNDGLLIIGTTNHFERLDPGISSRPSRFDRKYKFDDPDEEERKLYVQYWQRKLASNKDIIFPDALIDVVVQLTDRFSFAYLKEVFVSSLVTFLGIEGEKPSFESILKDQIDVLRKQLDKSVSNISLSSLSLAENVTHQKPPNQPRRPSLSLEQDVHPLLDLLSESYGTRRVVPGLKRLCQETRKPQISLATSSPSAYSDVRYVDAEMRSLEEYNAKFGIQEAKGFRELLDRISSSSRKVEDIVSEKLYTSL